VREGVALSDESTKTSNNVNTDGREPFDWASKYPPEARKEMRFECGYVLILFVLAFTLISLNFFGALYPLFDLDDCQVAQFKYMVYFSSAGLLGGTVFGMKYFYRVVARGYWTQDRRYWRLLSPFISLGIAFIVSAMVSASLLSASNASTNYWAIAFGFFSGYFADEAVGKMYEIATLLFGKTTKK
jgi:hypothetical protein